MDKDFDFMIGDSVKFLWRVGYNSYIGFITDFDGVQYKSFKLFIKGNDVPQLFFLGYENFVYSTRVVLFEKKMKINKDYEK